MTKTLRKKHLLLWMALAMLLPVGIIGALIARPVKHATSLIARNSSTMLIPVLDSVSTPQYTVRLRCAKNGLECQLEYINHLPLQLPSALLYRMKPGAASIDEHELLGRIGSKGRYYFPLSSAQGSSQDTPAFILYDFIHRSIVDTIKF